MGFDIRTAWLFCFFFRNKIVILVYKAVNNEGCRLGYVCFHQSYTANGRSATVRQSPRSSYRERCLGKGQTGSPPQKRRAQHTMKQSPDENEGKESVLAWVDQFSEPAR